MPLSDKLIQGKRPLWHTSTGKVVQSCIWIRDTRDTASCNVNVKKQEEVLCEHTVIRRGRLTGVQGF
jgi:hypothetical protein